MSKIENIKRDNLNDSHWLGVIVNSNDPDKKYRCQIRVFGKYDDLEDQDLPWATPINPQIFGQSGGSGAGSYPKRGHVVHVRFNNGNIFSPEYNGIQELSDDLIKEIAESYENSHVLCYDGDEKLKIFYTQNKGFILELDESRINIENDNTITIEHKDTTTIIELRGGTINITADSEINITGTSRVKIDSSEVWANGKNTKVGHVPSYSGVLAEPLFAFLKALAATVDTKYPQTPNFMYKAAETCEILATSDTVKISK